MSERKFSKGGVAHLTSVHHRSDTRIFLKECRTLARAGRDVSLIVADGLGDDCRDGVRIFDVQLPLGRLDRMFRTTHRVFLKACELDADIHHLHDPELIPVGLRLKAMGKKVIFDSHEDVPRQLLSKYYLNMAAKKILSKAYGRFESFACRRFDVIIAATPFIRDKFLKINPHSFDVNNFPFLDELVTEEIGRSPQKNKVCYIGGITKIRGVQEMVRAMELVVVDVRLQLGGKFSESSDSAEVKKYPGWQRVDELGVLDRRGVREMLAGSMAGLVILHPIDNYIDALPVKMFEYMSAGVPVIASNFPLWQEIVEGNDCGLCVDPLDPVAVAWAIDFLVANPKRAEQMGKNGQKAVREKYNWNREAEKLLRLYGRLVEDN